MRLYLVRHGQSEGNVAKTFHGHTDYPLTELGREQARQAGEKLKDTAFVRCVASDLSRAWDTALSCVAGRGMIPERCPGLREQFVGEMEGLSWDEMERRYPGVREAYISDWFHTTPPRGNPRRRWPAGLETVWTRSLAGRRTPSWWPTTALCPWCWPTWGLRGRKNCFIRAGFSSRGAIPPWT